VVPYSKLLSAIQLLPQLTVVLIVIINCLVRLDGRWLSSPILNRAIGWNNSGLVKIGRLSLQENIITSSGQRLPILAFRRLRTGLALPAILLNGEQPTPLNDNEIIVGHSE